MSTTKFIRLILILQF